MFDYETHLRQAAEYYAVIQSKKPSKPMIVDSSNLFINAAARCFKVSCQDLVDYLKKLETETGMTECKSIVESPIISYVDATLQSILMQAKQCTIKKTTIMTITLPKELKVLESTLFQHINQALRKVYGQQSDLLLKFE